MPDAPPAEPQAPATPQQEPPAEPQSQQATPRPTRLQQATAADPPANPPGNQPPVTPQQNRMAPASDQPPIVGEDLSLRPGWVGELGEEYAQFAKTGQKFDNLGGLLKSYANLESLRSVPAPDATEDQKAAFREANRIPGDPKSYAEAIPLPQLPDGGEIPKEILDRAAQAGLEANMHPSQMGAMVQFQMELTQDAVASQERAESEAKEQAFEQLEQEWGRDKDANYSNAEAAGKMLGLDLADPAIGDNPSLIRALAQIHSKLDEDTLRAVSNAGPVNNGGGQGDRAKARDIVTNPANPLNKAYHDPSDPGHQAAHQKVDMYNASATGFRP